MTKAPPPLTEEQIRALDLAAKQGGKLHRNEVSWGQEDFDASPEGMEKVFAYATVRDLVNRGLLRWSCWARRTGTTYPVEAELVEARA